MSCSLLLMCKRPFCVSHGRIIGQHAIPYRNWAACQVGFDGIRARVDCIEKQFHGFVVFNFEVEKNCYRSVDYRLSYLHSTTRQFITGPYYFRFISLLLIINKKIAINDSCKIYHSFSKERELTHSINFN